jgi:hypothetical protein
VTVVVSIAKMRVVTVLVAMEVRKMVLVLVVVGVVQGEVRVERQEQAEETRDALHSEGM